MTIPAKQRAVQLVGEDKLVYNENKAVHQPNDYQVLAKIEAVGLCFSDLKLLKQFSGHSRKSAILSGISADVLKEIPSYAIDQSPTVPGHEAVVRVVKAGNKVKGITEGQRYLVQTDYRWLPTANSNAAFGYNFEGALQEYVVMDQRVITSPDGESMLIPASDNLSASAIALVEPWACVEDAYVVHERQRIKSGSKMLIAADCEIDIENLKTLFEKYGQPSVITIVGSADLSSIDIKTQKAERIETLADAGFDDILYFGSDADTIEKLFPKLAVSALFNIVLCGGKVNREITCKIGRVHYGNVRIIGTKGNNPCDAMAYIPKTGEIRKGDKVEVVGAGGPMGVMHTVRNVCQGVEGITVYAGDLDDNRLALLNKIVNPLAKKNNVNYVPYNPSKGQSPDGVTYLALMAPITKLITSAIKTVSKGAIINIFAGIAATVDGQIDIDQVIDKQIYFIGTSGSTLEDMKTVLNKVETGKLDTNISVAAVCGIKAAVDGIRAVEKQLIPGKIIVYPSCGDLPLTRLEELDNVKPDAAKKLNDGLWTKEAEAELTK